MATVGPKLYFHNATTTNTGTLPGASTQSSTSPGVTATGASTNRVLDDTIGTSQASLSLTTLAQATAQNNWFGRFMTAPLAAQTISNAGWYCGGAASQSSTNSVFNAYAGCIYVWRPSGGGTLVGKIDDHNAASGIVWGSSAATAETWSDSHLVPVTLNASVTTQDGDVLVVEIWSIKNQTQSMATAYTNTVFYDGTTEVSSTSAASYIVVNNNTALTLSTGVAASTKRLGLLGVG